MSSLNAGVSTLILSASRYDQRSSAYSARVTRDRAPRTPVATALSGHRSRTSKTSGARWRQAVAMPDSATSSGGDVAMTTSGRWARSPAHREEAVNTAKA